MCKTPEYSSKELDKANDKNNQSPDDLKKGIVMDRGCTDVLICIIFFVFFCGMFATAAYGYAYGDPSKLLTPFDYDGNQCGGDKATDYPYLIWPDIDDISNGNTSVLSYTMCVKTCPGYLEKMSCYPNSIYKTCPTTTVYTTSLYLSIYCLPNVTDYKDALVSTLSDGDLSKYMSDLVTSWYVFLIMGGITSAICLIYLFLLRCIAKPILYISFVLIFGLLVGGGFYVFFLYKNYADGDQTQNVMKGMGILLWILSGIYLLILCCCWSRIQLGTAIIEAASDFVRNTTSIFIIPFIFFFIIGIWVVFWVISAVYVYTVGTAEKSDYVAIANITWNNTTRYVWIYHLFGLFWISAFIIGCAQFIIAATCGLWYFSQGGSSDDKAKGSLLTGIRWIFRYHMGSIAFGAFIIAVMQMIKLLFEYMRRKYNKLVGNNMCLKCIICCVGYCIWCLDYCVKHITKNAFIQIALTGKSFCPSCWLTFWLIVRNCARFSMVTSIGFILMFIGKALIVILSGWIAYLIIMNSDLKNQINSPVFPIVIVVIIAYLLASIFLSIFSFASTTILHCFIIDEEIKGGHQPKSLQSFIDKNNAHNEKRNKVAGGGNKPEEKPKDADGKDEKPANNLA